MIMCTVDSKRLYDEEELEDYKRHHSNVLYGIVMYDIVSFVF